MMKTTLILAVATATLIGASAASVQAQDFNKRRHLPPEAQAKVSTVMARVFRDKNSIGSGSKLNNRITNVGCGGLSVGDFSNAKKPPREVIIVADSIINISKNCK